MTSPDYPHLYDVDAQGDSWLITAPAGHTVTIDFVDFEIPGKVLSNCGVSDDYVSLYDGNSASDPRIGDDKYCVNSIGSKETSSNNLLVTFTANNAYRFFARFYVGGQYE